MRTILSKTLLAAGIGSALSLSACVTSEPASPNVPSYQYQAQPAYPAPPPVYEQRGRVVSANLGTVSAIDYVPGQRASGISPGGAILGAVVGGLLGNQVGAGGGKALATVAGVGAGAYAGNQVGNRVESTQGYYRVAIALDNGAMQYIDVPAPGDLRVGERVRIDGNQISRA